MDKFICQIVDSSGGLPRSFIKQYGISEVPFYFKFNNPDYYRENVDYQLIEFYKHMEDYPDEVPKTSAPNINDWLTVFEEKYAKGAKKYIVTTISAKLSSSFQTANLAKNIFMKKNSDVQVEVVDSNTCACGQAALEVAIAKMIERNDPFQDIIKTIDKTVANINTLFVVNSLKYMESGGRIGGATAFVGKLAQIKPICEFIDGVVHPTKAVIGRRSSLKKMMDIAISRIIDINKLIITIQSAGFEEDTDYAISYLRKTANFTGQIYKSELGITVGAHSGPGAVGIGFVVDSLA
ncbi:MAG: DegV family protein [Lawsonibacter sp.]|nr:DegV family protein [Lawsonibacter sp.]